MASHNSPLRFAILFIGLFLAFYYFNIGFFGITSPGKVYSPFLANHLNYIAVLRSFLLWCSAAILKCFGFAVITNDNSLLLAGHGEITLVYTCLGLGVLSFFGAFVIAYPKPIGARLIFLVAGILGIQFLNILRFVVLAIFWDKKSNHIVDHHTIFNVLIYIIIGISLYFWVTADAGHKTNHVKN
ncbi:archaeosortase/exosortase family protein [Mucilaginibacter sp. dw_454]|uniref:exosortase Y n=1 Tax=Mucilaginibacter sp. dw_454 TaxID=2720079 RepID=UPI001BD6563B|nr:archaeosortase/exosortase family protein [Mucilaginibacter sp. dw_454]